MTDSDAEIPADFANQLEQCTVVRGRFRKQIGWLQWPVSAENVLGDEENGEVEQHPVCTKSLEMNVDAVRAMVEHYHGDFVDISTLSAEALGTHVACLKMFDYN